MTINYRLSWDKNKIAFLKKYNVKISYEYNIILVEFNSDTDNFNDILSFAKSHDYSIISEPVFNTDEMEKAEWYAIENTWVNLYPQPSEKFGYLNLTYDLSNYCDGNEPKFFCRQGKIQKNLFKLNKQPNWNSRNIMRLNWVYEELFISSKCRNLILNSNLCGFKINNVYIKDEISTSIFQIFIENELPYCIKKESFELIYKCPKCRREKYYLKSDFIYVDKNVFKDLKLDIVKSKEKIGGINADSLIIISKKFYQFLDQNKLSRGMKFIPIKLI